MEGLPVERADDHHPDQRARRDLDVERAAELAGLHALLEHFLDHPGQLPVHIEESGLPGAVRAPLLGHEQSREVRLGYDEVEAGRRHRLQGVGRAAALGERRPGGRAQRLGQGRDAVAEEVFEQLGLAREVVVDRALGHARPFGDLVDGGGGEALFGDEGDGRVVEALPGRTAPGARGCHGGFSTGATAAAHSGGIVSAMAHHVHRRAYRAESSHLYGGSS